MSQRRPTHSSPYSQVLFQTQRRRCRHRVDRPDFQHSFSLVRDNRCQKRLCVRVCSNSSTRAQNEGKALDRHYDPIVDRGLGHKQKERLRSIERKNAVRQARHANTDYVKSLSSLRTWAYAENLREQAPQQRLPQRSAET
eukprot:SAG11_NODE_14808_length_599_cov_0.696000_1_plen_139_part_10